MELNNDELNEYAEGIRLKERQRILGIIENRLVELHEFELAGTVMMHVAVELDHLKEKIND